MNWKESYSDTCNELRILLIREEEIRRRVDMAHKVILSGKMPSSGDYVHISLDKAIEKYNREVESLKEIQEEVDRVDKIKTEMEQYMDQFTGLAHVIECKRLNGRSHKEIADELGYSENYIRTYIYKRGYKKDTHNTNAS